MTLAETRQLGIEFERRVQTMIPETEFLGKLDTDTIYLYKSISGQTHKRAVQISRSSFYI